MWSLYSIVCTVVPVLHFNDNILFSSLCNLVLSVHLCVLVVYIITQLYVFYAVCCMCCTVCGRWWGERICPLVLSVCN